MARIYEDDWWWLEMFKEQSWYNFNGWKSLLRGPVVARWLPGGSDNPIVTQGWKNRRNYPAWSHIHPNNNDMLGLRNKKNTCVSLVVHHPQMLNCHIHRSPEDPPESLEQEAVAIHQLEPFTRVDSWRVHHLSAVGSRQSKIGAPEPLSSLSIASCQVMIRTKKNVGKK